MTESPRLDQVDQTEVLQLSSIDELISHADKVIKYSLDGGQRWNYAKLEPRTHVLQKDTPVRSLGGDVELTENIRSPMNQPFFASLFEDPDFIAQTTTPTEVEGKRFSYEELRKSLS